MSSRTGVGRKLLSEGMAALKIDAPPEAIGALMLFIEELLLWNRKTNLIGTSDKTEIIQRHILDSLTVYPLLKPYKGPILDIGAGAGFPSVPLAVVDKTLSICAVERRRKRASFLRNAAAILGLNNLTVLECDARNVKGRYAAVMARGVGELALLYDLSKGFLKEKSMIIAFKGKITEIEKEVSRLKGKQTENEDYNLNIQKVKIPGLDEEERNIVIIETR
jgi:16S rRNA (guanine527-N7)-methyltransferase